MRCDDDTCQEFIFSGVYFPRCTVRFTGRTCPRTRSRNQNSGGGTEAAGSTSDLYPCSRKIRRPRTPLQVSIHTSLAFSLPSIVEQLIMAAQPAEDAENSHIVINVAVLDAEPAARCCCVCMEPPGVGGFRPVPPPRRLRRLRHQNASPPERSAMLHLQDVLPQRHRHPCRQQAR
jgi:hypothetical protein